FNSRPNENSYCYQLLRQLNEQRKKGILCDVSIVVSGKIFKAHKNILVAGSRFFKTLYCFSNKESPNQNNTTHLDIAAVQGFSVILDFLYSGNLVLTSQNAIEVMTVASYLQMSEVVQTCRNFIKDALNISIKSEAPESVVVDYNNRKPVNRDGLSSSRDQKIASFWATRNLTNLASNDGSPELAESESQGQTKVFIWNDMGSQGIQETGKTRRKNQTTKSISHLWCGDIFNCQLLISWSSQSPLKLGKTTEPQLKRLLKQDSFKELLVAVGWEPRDYRAKNVNSETVALKIENDSPPLHPTPNIILPTSSWIFGRHTTRMMLEVTSRNLDIIRALYSKLWAQLPYSPVSGRLCVTEASVTPADNSKLRHISLLFNLHKKQFQEEKLLSLKQCILNFHRKIRLFEQVKNIIYMLAFGESSLTMNKLKCPHCSYVAKYRRTLKRHLLIHTGVRSFSCDICGKLFTRREHVKRHSLVHKKDKKYKCMVCKKIFMLAASVGIRHGSRRYGVCVDCADKSQPGGQEGVDQGQDTDFPRDEEYEENEGGEADEELVDDGE
uniref:Zinc finger and BTB domain containing 10 n=1 Tax=Loxodonta africana TaxID=9785 RepID=G3TYX4_LOXAF